MKLVSSIITIFYLYHLCFFVVSLGLKRTKNGSFMCPQKSKFAVFIPAHNEQNVIKESLKSIFSAHYPKDSVSVYVVADNCTDKTCLSSKAVGANVLERFDSLKRGKQFALEWAFNQIDLSQYDAVVILDADNHIDQNFFSELNYQLQRGNRVIQGYVETKNPNESWITMNYAYIFWYMLRLQMIRSKLGMSAWMAGTGICISTEVLKKVGWNVTTLCDDIELTCQLILKGERVKFADAAIVYDQKPKGLMNSMKQRLRWIRGQTQVCLKYYPKLALNFLKNLWKGSYREAICSLDAIMWVPMQLVILASFVTAFSDSGFKYFLSVILTTPILYILPLVAEKVKLKKAWIYLISTGFFFLTWIPITAYGVITNDKQSWWRTPH